MCNFPKARRGDIVSIQALTLCPWCGAKQEMFVRGWFCGCRDSAEKHIDVVDGTSRCKFCGRGTGHYLVEEPEKPWKLEPPFKNTPATIKFDAQTMLDNAAEHGATITITERKIVFDCAAE